MDCNVINDTLAARYPNWLDAGIHILSSNLSGTSGSLELYNGIQVRRPLSGVLFVFVFCAFACFLLFSSHAGNVVKRTFIVLVLQSFHLVVDAVYWKPFIQVWCALAFSICPSDDMALLHCPQSVVEDGLRFTSFTDEASLAPGVPIMRTLDDVMKTGDTIVRVEAMLNPGINVALAGVCAPTCTPKPYKLVTPRQVNE